MRDNSHITPGPAQSADASSEDRSATLAVAAFPLIILVGAVVAFFFPAPFVPMAQYITYMLMVIMFTMGLTLTVPDFQEILRRPIPIVIGVLAQFIVMPLGAVAVAKAFNFNPQLAVGLLMLGSVPGGTASNVIAYLAKGDVALSVAMTSVSTMLAPFVTPLLMLGLAGAETDVNASAMAISLMKSVLIPVTAGLVINFFAERWVAKILPILPWLSIFAILMVVLPNVAKNSAKLATVGLLVVLAVILHNMLGYLLGYVAARVTRQPVEACRTTAIEVGTQNSGLATGMAAQFFSAEAALPSAVASVLHNVNGAIYAALVRWRAKSVEQQAKVSRQETERVAVDV
ncbi:bile acid:sodium symporter family protein [Corynebacterium epidermidicanis]|uniref:Putative Na+-dependent transporter n=1 Tax=Corynebacterium epidermidicanis TaxID=1050174 RepID=A0A0G3GR66_9CORY|nr:bile acid:sodium symporter family protein [Corynebacterium epidermidicanis]AKK03661.1 putative Na+-dependent transporter [Corynebacterium epidermidicanis]